MRLAGQIKAGFYAAPLAAVELAAKHIVPCEGAIVLDPCAGEGEAVSHLAKCLGIPTENVYGIELDAGRGKVLQGNVGHALTPATIFGTAFPAKSASILWLNPPFDDDLKGGRTEADFLRVAANWLQPGGTMCLVCPEKVVEHWSMKSLLHQDFDSFTILEFPEECRRFNEVIVLAEKRKSPRSYSYSINLQDYRALDGWQYHLPPGREVKWFHRSELPEEELALRLAKSPLQNRLKVVDQMDLKSPPLALGTGHLALLLASGQLDGLVSPADERPHVVRGTARKVQVKMGTSESEDTKGNTKTVTTYTERIQLIVRAVWPDGKIHEFTDGEVQDGTGS